MMWVHFCECDKTLISVESGEPCNWCDAREFKCEEVEDE